MLIEQQPAYVLHARPYRETSLLLECLTRDHGRLGVVARGVRRERARLQRAQIEPFQPLALDFMLRGELAALRAAEPLGAPSSRLLGDAGLAGLYLNELVVRMTGRQDPQPQLFDHYALALRRLLEEPSLAWTLRRFERDLLQVLGYDLQLLVDEHGEPLEPQRLYRYEVEQGPLAAAVAGPQTLRGGDLLALAHDRQPDPQGLANLRRMMREVIRFYLGGSELRAWRVLALALSRR